MAFIYCLWTRKQSITDSNHILVKMWRDNFANKMLIGHPFIWAYHDSSISHHNRFKVFDAAIERIRSILILRKNYQRSSCSFWIPRKQSNHEHFFNWGNESWWSLSWSRCRDCRGVLSLLNHFFKVFPRIESMKFFKKSECRTYVLHREKSSCKHWILDLKKMNESNP